MKKTIILGLATAVIALGSLTASAGSDDSQYPAANFQPKVVFIDKDAIKTSAKPAPKQQSETKAEFDPKYPAAYFTPKVIYP